jgi:hypothetical protein
LLANWELSESVVCHSATVNVASCTGFGQRSAVRNLAFGNDAQFEKYLRYDVAVAAVENSEPPLHHAMRSIDTDSRLLISLQVAAIAIGCERLLSFETGRLRVVTAGCRFRLACVGLVVGIATVAMPMG